MRLHSQGRFVRMEDVSATRAFVRRTRDILEEVVDVVRKTEVQKAFRRFVSEHTNEALGA
ncbi:MAG: hypothetical protein GEV13_33505 [Rhodospirillales bacterium]|nr:hypothetical protein [Rhodospirillales bacterium]